MNTLKPYIGVALIVIGALLLGIGFWAGWTQSNFVLLGGLLLIIIGEIVYVKQQKKGEKY
jgi:membrane-bound ClpP family serine protease